MFDFITESLNSVTEKVKGVEHTFTFLIIFSWKWSFFLHWQKESISDFFFFLICFNRNGVPVRPNGRNILVSSDGSLVINKVKPSDEGTYTCNAYTGIYSVSATAEVQVTKHAVAGTAVPPGCFDQPELANCKLIVYARLCSNSYYSSFCCASCARHSQRNARFAGQLGWRTTNGRVFKMFCTICSHWNQRLKNMMWNSAEAALKHWIWKQQREAFKIKVS